MTTFLWWWRHEQWRYVLLWPHAVEYIALVSLILFALQFSEWSYDINKWNNKVEMKTGVLLLHSYTSIL